MFVARRSSAVDGILPFSQTVAAFTLSATGVIYLIFYETAIDFFMSGNRKSGFG
jgi:hypothetical protein